MSAFIVPCVWSLLVVIGFTLHISNPFKEIHRSGDVIGILWKQKAWVILPSDYHQFSDAQKIEFWKTGQMWAKRRTMRAIMFTPLIWALGFGVVYLVNSIHITF